MNKKITPSHYKIFEYWKDKCISYDGKIYKEGEYDYDKSIPVVNDWGEPECWCCGRSSSAIYDQKEYDNWIEEDDGIKKIWNSKETRRLLQKCHIIPEACGGLTNENNMFLMCSECHRETPDTIHEQAFFKYVYKCRTNRHYSKSFFDNEIIDMARECDEIGKNFFGIRNAELGKEFNSHG